MASSRGFVVLSTQRSGSNWLEDRLDGHPRISMVRGEPFRRGDPPADSYDAFRRSTRGRRLVATVGPIAKELYLRRTILPGDRQTGFRLMYDQLRRCPSLALLVRSHDLPVVHLVRKNVLATHISAVGARETGLFITRRFDRAVPPTFVDPVGLVMDLRRRSRLIERHRRLLRFAGVSAIEVEYEDYVSDPVAVDRVLLSHLGVEYESLSASFRKVGASQLSDRVANWEEVVSALRSTEFASLLVSH